MTTFDEAMLHRERVLDIRVGKYTGQQVKSARFDYGFQSGDAYTTGGTNAGSAKLNLDGIYTEFEKLQVLKPELALSVDGALEWVKMGTFYISDIKIDRNRNSTSLELIDGMFKLNEPYVSDLTYPAQIRDVIREIATKTGVDLATDNLGLKAIQYHIQAKPAKDKITFREVLGQACQLLGYNAFFNREGKLEIRGLTESGIRITADSYFLHGLEKSEIEYQIAGITCKADKQTLTVGLRTGRSLEIDNELMYQNLLDDLYLNLKNIRYYPYSLKWQGHLKLDVGQWVTLVTNKSETYKVPVFSQSFEFGGGLSSKISADSKASNDTQYTYGNFLTKKIEQMSTDIEAEVQQQLEWAEREFDEKKATLVKEVEDGIEEAKAAAELVKAEISQSVAEAGAKANQALTAMQAADQKAVAALNLVGANANLATEAKQLADQAKNEAQTANRLALEKAAQLGLDLNAAKQLLASQGQQQTELIQRVATTETGLAGIRDQYSQLNQAVSSQTGQITAVSRQTADLQRGLDGVTERFETAKIGTQNLVANSKINESSNEYGFGVRWVNLIAGRTYWFVGRAKKTGGTAEKRTRIYLHTQSWNENYWLEFGTHDYEIKNIKFTARHTERYRITNYWFPRDGDRSGTADIDWIMVTESDLAPTTWSAAEEDIRLELATYVRTATENSSRLEQSIQTADGKAESARTLAQQTADGLTLKAEKTAVDAATGRLTTAESTIRQHADQIAQRLTSTQVESAITAKGYQTKAQVDANVTGRGYITDAALVGYVPTTIFDNYKTETAQAIERGLTATRAMIPTEVGGRNLIQNGAFPTVAWPGTKLAKHAFYFNNQKTLFLLETTSSSEVTSGSNRFPVKRNTDYTLSFVAFSASRVKSSDVWFLGRKDGETADFTSTNLIVSGRRFSPSKTEYVTVTFNSGDNDTGYIRFDNNGSSDGQMASMFFGEVMLVEGRTAHRWTPALEDMVTSVDFNRVKETSALYERVIGRSEGDIQTNVARQVMTSELFRTEISKALSSTQNLAYDPTRYSRHIKRNQWSAIQLAAYSLYSGMRINQAGYTGNVYGGFNLPLRTSSFTAGEKLSLRAVIGIDALPDADSPIRFEIKNGNTIIAQLNVKPTRTGNNQVFTTTTTVLATTTTVNEYGLEVFIFRNGNVNVTQIVLVRGETLPTTFWDDTTTQDIVTSTRVNQLADSWAVKALSGTGDILSAVNVATGGVALAAGQNKLVVTPQTTYIQDGTIKNAMIDTLHGSKITAGTITSSTIAADAITAEKLKVDQALFDKLTTTSITAADGRLKNLFATSVQAVDLTASRIKSGIMQAINGAMAVNLDAANITFNQNATIDFGSSQNAIKRQKGETTAFVHFADDVYGGVYAGFGVRGGYGGVNSTPSGNGEFAGIRVFRANSNMDRTEIYGDTIELRHAFSQSGSLYFKQSSIAGRDIDMGATLIALANMWVHYRNLGQKWEHSSPDLAADYNVLAKITSRRLI